MKFASENWAGYQAIKAGSDIFGTEQEAVTIESIGNPSPTDNLDSCPAVSVWNGIGDAYMPNNRV